MNMKANELLDPAQQEIHLLLPNSPGSSTRCSSASSTPGPGETSTPAPQVEAPVSCWAKPLTKVRDSEFNIEDTRPKLSDRRVVVKSHREEEGEEGDWRAENAAIKLGRVYGVQTKPMQYKAAKQRRESMAKRDLQRAKQREINAQAESEE